MQQEKHKVGEEIGQESEGGAEAGVAARVRTGRDVPPGTESGCPSRV
jgi:hypothetical protein